MKKLLVVALAVLVAPAGFMLAGHCKPKRKHGKKHDHGKVCPPKKHGNKCPKDKCPKKDRC